MSETPTTASAVGTVRRQRPARSRTAAVAPAKRPAGPKESKTEELIHELFRLAKVDLRGSAHGKELAAALASSIEKGG